MYFDWNKDKNESLKKTRSVCFEDFLIAFENDKVFDIIKHHNLAKYSNQMIFVVEIKDETKYFLKNIIPSRKLNKQYKGYQPILNSYSYLLKYI